MGFLGIGKRKSISADETIGLTELGKMKAETMSLPGVKGQVLAVMLERGGVCQLTEIRDEVHMPIENVRSIVKHFIRAGFMKVMSPDAA